MHGKLFEDDTGTKKVVKWYVCYEVCFMDWLQVIEVLSNCQKKEGKINETLPEDYWLCWCLNIGSSFEKKNHFEKTIRFEEVMWLTNTVTTLLNSLQNNQCIQEYWRVVNGLMWGESQFDACEQDVLSAVVSCFKCLPFIQPSSIWTKLKVQELETVCLNLLD